MKKLKELTCHQALRISNLLFCGGLLLLAAAGLLLNVHAAPRALTAFLMAVWFLLWAAGAVLSAWKVRCPHCGADLRLGGGRMRLHLPPHCPSCGARL